VKQGCTSVMSKIKVVLPKAERTFVAIKPDGVKRGLIGEVVKRFESAGLKVVGLKMVTPTAKQVKGTYPGTEEWLKQMGEKTLRNYKEYGKDPLKELGTDDPLKIGKMIEGWIVKYWTSGPIVCLVLEGNQAIEVVRMIAGYTIPASAPRGTIRGDFSIDSPILANLTKRPVKNIIHASGNRKEAEHEINHWFKPSEIHYYRRADEAIMFE